MAIGIDPPLGSGLLARVWLFAGCTPSELGAVARSAGTRAASPGEWLVREGEPGDELFVIVEGRAVVTIAGTNVAELGPDDFFGELALVDGGERNATVQARTAMRLLVVSRPAFNELLATAMPTVAPKLLQVMGERLRALAAIAGGLPGWV